MISRITNSNLIYNKSNNQQCYLTICIPTFSRGGLLLHTLKSVEKSKPSSTIQIIICDNNPNTKDVSFLDDFHFENIKYYTNQENIGMVGNWNQLLCLAETKWIAFLHDDDLLDKNYFKYIKKIIKNCDEKTAYIKASFIPFFNEGSDIGKLSLKNKIKKMIHVFQRKQIKPVFSDDVALFGNAGFVGAPTCGTLINREIALDVGGYNENNYVTADSYFPVTLLSKGYKIGKSSRILGYYRYFNNESYKDDTINYFLEDFFNQNAFISQISDRAKEIVDTFKNEQFVCFLEDFICPMLKKKRSEITKADILNRYHVVFCESKYKHYKKIKRKCIFRMNARAL